MKKVCAIIILTIIFLIFSAVPVRASYGGLEGQLGAVDFSGLNRAVSDIPGTEGLDIGEMALKAAEGGLDLSPGGIIAGVLNALFGEIADLGSLMKNMVLIAIIGAMFKNLSESFKQKSVSETGFYVTYAVVLTILLSSVGVCLGVVKTVIADACGFMEAAVPVITGLMVMTGRITPAYAFNPVLVFIIDLITVFTRDWLVPLIMAAAGIELVNYISEKNPLSKLAELIKKSAGWILKGTALVFAGVLSLQGIASPAVDNGITKSAKAAVGVVPVVGQALLGAVDSVAAWAGAAKAGTLAVMIIVIVLICAAPLIKLLAFTALFKLTAGLIQPISDKRIVKAVDATGSYASLLLGAGVLVAVMFIFAVMITLSL